VRQLRREALRYRRDLPGQVTLTSDPTVRAVFADEAAAIALVGVALHQVSGSPAPPAVKDEVRSFVTTCRGVVSVSELLVPFVGPRQVWVLARLDVDDQLKGDAVEALVRGIGSGLEEQSDFIARINARSPTITAWR
jgi:hypothetical protein